MRSAAFMSDSSTHESCEGEYPFHRTRYCFFFVRPKRLDWSTCSTSHSGLPSMMSGGGSIQFGPCASVSRYGIKRDAWKML